MIHSAGKTAGGYQLEISAPPGIYQVGRSTTLLPPWDSVGPISPVGGFGQITDPAALSLPSAFYRIAGGFKETPIRLIAMKAVVSSSGTPPFDIYGGLRIGHARETIRFQSADPSTGLVRTSGGQFMEFSVEPGNSDIINGYVEQWEDSETLNVAINSTFWNITLDEGSFTLLKAEGGDHSLVGINSNEDTYEEQDDFGTYTSTEKAKEILWGIAQSDNAAPADLAGNWGFVRFLVDGNSSDGVCSGMIWETSITAGPNPRPFSITTFSEFEIGQVWETGGVEVFSRNDTQSPAVVPTITLAPDGGMTLDVVGGISFSGVVSPSAKLLVAAASIPDIGDLPDGESDAFLADLDMGESQWMVAVKRTNTPQLAGKTYRIIHQGLWFDEEVFEVNQSGENDRLVFDANGTSVTRTSEFILERVLFDGTFESGSDLLELEMAVTVNGAGRISLEGGEPGEYTIRTLGYCQDGSNLLVMMDTLESEEGGAGVGLIIAVLEP